MSSPSTTRHRRVFALPSPERHRHLMEASQAKGEARNRGKVKLFSALNLSSTLNLSSASLYNKVDLKSLFRNEDDDLVASLHDDSNNFGKIFENINVNLGTMAIAWYRAEEGEQRMD
uniref:Uncharacterized protein n=1 Tax=Chenopodium quinoa TaxID=63459 RepID=A0A803N1M3_CHEQI